MGDTIDISLIDKSIESLWQTEITNIQDLKMFTFFLILLHTNRYTDTQSDVFQFVTSNMIKENSAGGC